MVDPNLRRSAGLLAALIVAMLAAVSCGSVSTTTTGAASDGSGVERPVGTAPDSTTTSVALPSSTAAIDDDGPPAESSDPPVIGTWARVTPEPKFCAIEQGIDAIGDDVDVANPCGWSWALTGTAGLDASGSAVFELRDGRCEGQWTTTGDSITVEAVTCDPAAPSAGRPKVADLALSPDGRPGCFQVTPRDDQMDGPVLFCPGTSPTTTP